MPDNCPTEEEEARDVPVSAPTLDESLGGTLPGSPWFEGCEEELLPLVLIVPCPFVVGVEVDSE